MTTVCPKCKEESHSPIDVKCSWCPSCDSFHYATMGQELIDLNRVINDFQKNVRSLIADGDPFSLQIDQFTDNAGVMCWRAFIKVGSRVREVSTRPHVTPTDAVHELSMIVENGQ